MSTFITINAANKTFVSEESNIVTVLTGGANTLFAAFKSETNAYVSSVFAGRLAIIVAALSAFGAYWKGQRDGAKAQAAGKKLFLESEKSMRQRLGLPEPKDKAAK